MKLIEILGQNFEVLGSTGKDAIGGTLLCAPIDKDFDLEFFNTFFSPVTGIMGDREVVGLWPIKVISFQDDKLSVLKYERIREKPGEA